MRRLHHHAPRFVVAGAIVLALCGAASAQHGKFVLFGEPDPAFADAPKEHTFVHPTTSPYFNENSFVTTDLRLWYAYQKFDMAPRWVMDTARWRRRN